LQPKVIQITLLDSQFERWQIEKIVELNKLVHIVSCEIHE